MKYLLSLFLFCVITLPATLVGAISRLLLHRSLVPVRQLKSIKTILIIRFDGVGDALLTSGFAVDLKRLYPDARILVVVDDKFAPFVKLLDGYDEVIGLDYPQRTLWSTVTSVPRLFSFCKKNLWNRNIDLAINPRWDRDLREFGLVGYFSMARSHMGYEMFHHNDKHLRNPGYGLLYSDLVLENGSPGHELERHRDIIRYLGGGTFF